jgi:hypothetical protein
MNAIFRTLAIIMNMNMDLETYLLVQLRMQLRQNFGSRQKTLKKIL